MSWCWSLNVWYERWEHIFSSCWCVNMGVQKFGSTLKFVSSEAQAGKWSSKVLNKECNSSYTFVAVFYFQCLLILPNVWIHSSLVWLRNLYSLTSPCLVNLASPQAAFAMWWKCVVCQVMGTYWGGGQGEAVIWLQGQSLNEVVSATCEDVRDF